MSATQSSFPAASFPSSTPTPPVSVGNGLTISTAGTISLTTTSGAVGTYAFLTATGTSISAGSTYAGSSLRFGALYYSTGACVVYLNFSGTGTPSGTWQAMGTVSGSDAGVGKILSVFVRIV